MKRKAAMAVLLALALCLSPFTGGTFKEEAVAQGSIEIRIQDKPLALSTPAYIDNGTTLVPLREVAEALGANVVYNDAGDGSKSVTIERNGRTARIAINSITMTASGKNVKLPLAPRIENDITMVPLRAVSESLGTIVAWDGIKQIVSIDEPKELPTIGTPKKLMELLQASINQNNKVIMLSGAAEMGTAVSAETSSDAGAKSDGESAPTADDHSTTNVQVDGVDEADWAKTDGHFVYQISGNRVIITNIADPANPKLAAVLEYDDKKGFTPQELYVGDNRLVVIGQDQLFAAMPLEEGNEGAGVDSTPPNSGSSATQGADPVAPDNITSEPVPDEKRMSSMPYMNSRSLTTTLVYNLSDAGEPALARELSQEGGYVSSRMVGDSIYIVTNKYNNFYPLYNKSISSDAKNATSNETSVEALAQEVEPLYRDSAVSDKPVTLPLDEIRYFPNPTDNSMMLVGAADLSTPDQELQVSAYLGSGNTIYASEKHLYVAIAKYEIQGDDYKESTVFHKFRLDQGKVVYIGEGSVPGSLLNQFSMDEYNGYFRVALTKGNMWASGEQGSTNNVFVLDEKLTTIGKLEGLAPGERIYSVRFMGDRAYMVTFRNVDPLFALDLSNPTKPNVLGQLKIPGYSDYLHPYDENHIIGFGKETVEVPSKGMGPDETMAFYQGMKIAMFDVTDVTQPKELFKEVIGDRGTGSELLYNHKALLFSKAKGIMAFPVELYEIKNKEAIKPGEMPAYGEFVYQGAYVYGVDLVNGFNLKGRISHLSDADLKKSGQYGYDYNKTVRRILYAGDTLYTLSDAMLKATGLSDLTDKGMLSYPPLPQPSYWGDGGTIDMMPMPAVTPAR
ncbi:beta-propeller domain-containing protein [Paenibacillus sp. strain BS8-2]